MVFNPLFLQVVNNQETSLLNKTQKLTGPSYLFSDIIKVHLDKNETGSLSSGNETPAANDLLGTIISALSGQSAVTAHVQDGSGITTDPAAVIGQLNLPVMPEALGTNTAGNGDKLNAEDVNSLLVGNTELINFINSLLTNHQFDGKISIVNTETGSADNKDSVNNLSAGDLLDLLKNGNTIAVENSAFPSSNGLLITLVELADAAKTQAGMSPENPAGTDGTPANSKNIPSAQTLAGMIASQNAGIENGGVQAPGSLYKLKFSLVNNPEVTETAADTGNPIIKLPFTGGPGDSPFIKTSETPVQNSNLTSKANASQNASPIQDVSLPAGSVDKDSAGTNLKPAVETPKLSAVSQTGTDSKTAVENEGTVKDDAAAKNNVKDIPGKEPEIKTGKFSNIERVKADSELQVKEARIPELKNPELKNSELPNPETQKSGMHSAETLHTEENKTQKADEASGKKAAANPTAKLQDNTIFNPKEKDLNVSSTHDKQDTSSAAADKTDTGGGSAKNEMNNSSSKEQNHKSTESLPSNDRAEVKAKPQEDHSFNIGNQSKLTDNSFSVKRAVDSSPFGEAARTVKAAEIMKEISKFIQQGDKSSIVLKIDPENLGTVKIALDLANKVVHANIEVENEAARKLMENNLNQLYNSLSQSGVQLNSINISLANSEHKQGKMPNQKRRAFAGEGDKETDDIDGLRQKEMGYNTYDYLI